MRYLEDRRTKVGAFYVTLMTGLIAQWTFDPAGAPDAKRLTAGLREVVEAAKGAASADSTSTDGAP